MPRSLRVALIGLAAATLLLVASPASAAPKDGHGQQGQEDEHERIVKFWTPERVSKAKPRELFVADPGAGSANGGIHVPAPEE